MATAFWKRAPLVLAVVFAACGGHPVQLGIYTPIPEQDVMTQVHRKIVEMGYTVQRIDTVAHQIVAHKTSTTAGGADKEEIAVSIGHDVTGSTKLSVTTARLLAATADRPTKRIAASSKTNADGNALIQLFMKLPKQ